MLVCQMQAVEMHDAAVFHLTRSEAVALDPQTRILLEVRIYAFLTHLGFNRLTAWPMLSLKYPWNGSAWKPHKTYQNSSTLQITMEALAGASFALNVMPDWAAHTGTYVGCMFTDYMQLLLHGHGWPTSGPLLTGNHAPTYGYTQLWTLQRSELLYIICLQLQQLGRIANSFWQVV